MAKMSLRKDDDGKQLEFLEGTRVWAEFMHSVPLLAKFLAYPSRAMVSLKVNYRGPGDFLAVCKRYNDDGAVEVCFGSGTDFVASLLGLEVAMDNQKWRLDKWANQ